MSKCSWREMWILDFGRKNKLLKISELMRPSLGSEWIIINLKNFYLTYMMYRNPGKNRRFPNSCINLGGSQHFWIIKYNGSKYFKDEISTHTFSDRNPATHTTKFSPLCQLWEITGINVKIRQQCENCSMEGCVSTSK